MKKVAIICSGGDAPGMNPCLRAAFLSAKYASIELVGIRNGYDGVVNGNFHTFSDEDLSLLNAKGGALIGSSRSEAFRTKEGRAKAFENLKASKVDALIAIGGDGTFTGAAQFQKEHDLTVIGIPGTIDNDLYGTDATLGYDTALNTVVDCIDKIRDTAGSHRRFFFVEVMGRDAGFIALRAGIAAGAEAIFVPELQDEMKSLFPVLAKLKSQALPAIVVVSEGDEAGGALAVADKVKALHPEYDCRVSVLGHMQRGGKPSAFDRVLGARFGAEAIKLLLAGERSGMIGLQHKDLKLIPFEQAVKEHKGLNPGLVTLLAQLSI